MKKVLWFIAIAAQSGTSFASVPKDQAANDAKYDNIFQVAFNVNDSGNKYARVGTANLIGIKQVSATRLLMTFLTAYHVYNGPGATSFGGIQFRGDGQTGSFRPTLFDNTVEVPGPRYGDTLKYTDILFLGVDFRIKTDSTDAEKAQFNAMKGLTPFSVALAPAVPEAGLDFTSAGYGVSSPGADAAHPGYNYVWKKEGDAYKDVQFGQRRHWKNKIVKDELFENNDYKFDSLRYDITEAQSQFGLPGDSGSGMIVDNKLVGILSRGKADSLGKDPKTGEDTGLGIKFGDSNGRFSKIDQATLDYVNEKNKLYLVPEPGTWAALGLGAVLLIRRRRYHR